MLMKQIFYKLLPDKTSRLKDKNMLAEKCQRNESLILVCAYTKRVAVQN